MSAPKPDFAYLGRLLRPGSTEAESEVDVLLDPLAQARIEAATLLREAREEAEAIRERAHASAEVEFEKRLAERLTAAVRDFNVELRECAPVLVEIVADALESIVSTIPSDAVIAGAIKAAARRHGGERQMTVFVSPRDFSRAQLAKLATDARNRNGVVLSTDATLSPGRCVLEVDGSRFEIGLEAQLGAFRLRAAKSISTIVGQGA